LDEEALTVVVLRAQGHTAPWKDGEYRYPAHHHKDVPDRIGGIFS
jgi:hypothetical protein